MGGPPLCDHFGGISFVDGITRNRFRDYFRNPEARSVHFIGLFAGDASFIYMEIYQNFLANRIE